jgi:uncharacterized protein (DUF608 family)
MVEARENSEKVQYVEGFSEIVSFSGKSENYPDHRGGGLSYLEYYRKSPQEVTWKTPVVPAERDTVFVFTGSNGETPGDIELYVNGRHVLNFESGVRKDKEWTNNGYKLRFDSKGYYMGNCGIYYLTVPAGQIVQGKACEIRVIHVSGDENFSWFMVKGYTDTITYEGIAGEGEQEEIRAVPHPPSGRRRHQTIFPAGLPGRQWVEFRADGFTHKATGVIYRDGETDGGLPLGGIGAGAIELNTDGTLGRFTGFNSFHPQRILHAPFLGMAIDGQTWVLSLWKAKGIRSARQIHYWGHYPVADVEYETDAPVSVGLRAWSPFIPGDVDVSNTPGAIFEVRLRNVSNSPQHGVLAFSFPGPSERETGGKVVFQRQFVERTFTGLAVSTKGEYDRVEYTLGVIGKEKMRYGAGLGRDASAWANLGAGLPQVEETSAGTTIAVDFDLRPGRTKTIRFVLTWYDPVFRAASAAGQFTDETTGEPTHTYHHMYRSRFSSALEVAALLAHKHESLLQRILKWQEAIYADAKLQGWLRDSLVNNFHLIPEVGFWVYSPVKGYSPNDWYGPDGLFCMVDEPYDNQGSPYCIWRANLPIALFFPELEYSLLRGFAHYQLKSGEIPFAFGRGTEMGYPVYGYGDLLNGFFYAQAVDRLWQTSRDKRYLRGLYPSAKAAIQFTHTKDIDNDGLLDMILGPGGYPNNLYDTWVWYGTSSHVAGLWLPTLPVAERMATEMDDGAFARDCWDRFKRGTRSLEEKLWNGEYYLLYNDPAGDRSSDTILANQLDGQLISRLHGVRGIFPPDHIEKVLEVVERLCLPVSDVGVVSAVRPDGTTDAGGGWFSTEIVTSQTLCLGMTMAYQEHRESGEKLIRDCMANMMLRNPMPWTMAFAVDHEGLRVFGRDMYDIMALWTVPAALANEDMRTFSAPGGLVDRVLRAGR